jgi:hypothetical protein
MISPGSRRKSRAPGVNAIDHCISQRDGVTVALELTPPRLQASKGNSVADQRAWIEELTRDVGYLRQEIKFYRECFEILQRFREAAYDVYQQLFLASYFPPTEERLYQLTSRLHRALQDSVRREVEAERDWKAFWGLKMDVETNGGFI